MTDSLESLGIIAGNRSLPLVFARQSRTMGVRRLIAVGFEGETDPALASLVDELVWLKVGQLSKMISAFASRNIQRCVMVGQIAPKNLYDVRPDLRAMALLLRLKEKNAHTIFGAIADELHKDGIELIEATPWLRPLMPAAGFHLGPKLRRPGNRRSVRLSQGQGDIPSRNRPNNRGKERDDPGCRGARRHGSMPRSWR